MATYIFGFNLLVQYSTIVTRLVYLSQWAPKLRKQSFICCLKDRYFKIDDVMVSDMHPILIYVWYVSINIERESED